MSFLVGQVLERTQLRFSRASPMARHDEPRRGLRTYGPYDWSTLGKDKVTATIMCPQHLTVAAGILSDSLAKGRGYFAGFQSLFRIPLKFSGVTVLASESPDQITAAVKKLSTENPDIVYVVTETRSNALYSTAKGILLGNGIPSQVVTAESLRPNEQLQWVIENIALASYAKVGGTPWVVASEKARHQVVIGVSRVKDRSGSMIVGIVTMFTQDGDFLLSDYLAPTPLQYATEDYVEGLANLIAKAYSAYKLEYGAPESIVIHICKRPGKSNEVDAAVRAIAKIGEPVPYALEHLNDDTNFRMFDTSASHCVPPSGLTVPLSKRRSVLLMDGIVNNRRARRGMPTPLEIGLDARSTIPVEEFPGLVRQVADFSRVNWRGFNAYATPATLNYSYLIAKMISEVGISNWNAIIAEGRLHDKAWFL